MFSERWTTKDQKHIPIKSNTFEEFHNFFSFLYVGECKITEDNVMIMYDLGEAYNVGAFKEYCVLFVKSQAIVPGNVLQFIEFAKKYNLTSVLGSIFDFIERNAKVFFNLPGFLDISHETLVNILERDYLNVKEDNVFLAVSWRLLI